MVWIITAGLSYVELGTMFPSSGGEYVYIMEGSGPLLAFLSIYTKTIVLQPSSIGIMSLTCARYFLVPFYNDGCGSPPHENIQMLAICVLCRYLQFSIKQLKLNYMTSLI